MLALKNYKDQKNSDDKVGCIFINEWEQINDRFDWTGRIDWKNGEMLI